MMQQTALLPDSRAKIVEVLWENPGLSRVELAEILGVDKSTMSRGVGRLLSNGILRETESRESGPKGGRKRTNLEVHGDWGLWLGLEVQPDACIGVLVDFAGRQRAEFHVVPTFADSGLEGVLESAKRMAVERSGILGIPLVSAGLAVPGVLRPGTGIVERSRPLGISEPTDLVPSASAVLGIDTMVENDVNCSCRAEMRFVDRTISRNFMFVMAEARKTGMSLGLGTVINGILHLGDHGAGGEILSVFRREGDDQLSLSTDILTQAASDTRALASVVSELAPQLAMLANALDIDRLVLGGLFRRHFDSLAPAFRAAAMQGRTYPDLANPEILPAIRGDEAVAYGAAIHFTDHLFEQSFWRNI
jgi:predicted NBD/HSP70 family sugar kinase